MILNKVVNAGAFFYCMNYYPPHTHITMLNSGTAAYHQMYYMIDGSGSVDARDGQDTTDPVVYTIDVAKGQLIDAGPTKDKYITISVSDQGAAVMAFNPMTDNQVLDVSILDSAQKTPACNRSARGPR